MKYTDELKLSDEVEAFVEFGQVLNRRMREYIASYLLQKLRLQSTWKPSVELKENYAAELRQHLDKLFEREEVLAELQQNTLLSRRILSEILFFFRNVAKKTQKQHPWQAEQATLEGWTARPLHILRKQWPYLLRDILSTAEFESRDLEYHRTRLKEIENHPDDHIFNLLIDDLLSIWDAGLQVRILRWQISQIKEQYEELAQNIQNKTLEIIRVKSILGNFSDYLEPEWNLNNSVIKEDDFEILDRFHQYLKDVSSIQQLADTLGSLREAELETLEERYEVQLTTYSTVRDPHYRSEISGITLGNSIPLALPQELSLLDQEKLEWNFLKKFADLQLMQLHYDDQLRIRGSQHKSQSRTVTRKKKKGPFIVCVDTSGSMEGEPEKIAKVLCFAIVRMASHQDRAAYLINFSTGIKTIDLKNITSELSALVDFLKMSFRGGTDISLALDEALRQLETNHYKDADVLVISDFIMYRISEEIMLRIARQQLHQGTAFHSLIISNEANERVVERFDHVWLYNTEEKNVVKRIYREALSSL